MRRFTALLIFCSTLCLETFAQPEPCGPNPQMTPLCADACIICDIDGFTGTNNDGIVGQAPPGFCTGTVHHMQWIGFIAGSTNLTLSVSVFNCQNNSGLEVGIYKSLDCQTFELVSNCDGGIPANTTQNFTNTVPLTIGQYYYFVMDGNNDDVCSYTIKVVNGTTEVLPLENSGNIVGPDIVCANVPSDFFVSLPPGAAHFNWTLNGSAYASENDTTVSLNFSTPGLNQLCVTASNTCDTALPACRNIWVEKVPDTNINTKICAGECYTYDDTTICNAGVYNFHYLSARGCDSLVRVSVEVLQNVSTSLSLALCDGDSIFIGNTPFFSSGQFQETLQSPNGCDSIVNLSLQIIQCEIQGDITPVDAVCNGQASGLLQFSIANGTPPFNYQWERIGATGPAGTGSLNALQSQAQIPGLPAGTYFVTVSDNFGNDVVLFSTIEEPPVFKVNDVQLSDYQGFNVKCFGDPNGSAAVVVGGGNAPYTYLWSTGAATATLSGLAAGTYTCTATDARGCSLVQTVSLESPLEILLETQFEDPGCAGYNTGRAEVGSVSGGAGGFTFALNGGGFDAAKVFTGLSAGAYVLTAKDANGCAVSDTATLIAPIIPEVELADYVSVKLGEGIQLEIAHSNPIETYTWTPAAGLSCVDCPEPFAMPYFSTLYTLTVAAPGGCTAADSMVLEVIPQRDVYIPNVFSPNDDGRDDYFTVYGGPEVASVQLEVYSRWGEMIYQSAALRANDEYAGWDGFFRGQALAPGVFVYRAVVTFVDNVTLEYSGNVTLLR